MFGINRFHTYLYGRPFRVITDHKPLDMIAKKPLLRAPPRFQKMLQKIPGYDFTIEYRQGKTMTLADTLSRLPNPKDKGAVELDLRVDGIEMTTAEVHRCDRLGQLFTEETASTSRPDSQRSDHECALGNHHPRMA